MSRKPKVAKQRSEIVARAPAAAQVGSMSRMLAAISIGAAVVGALVVYWRLAPANDRGAIEIAAPVGRDPLTPPEPAKPTYNEVVAEGCQLADELAEAFPADADNLAKSGRMAFTFGSPKKARARWEQAVELDPQSGEAWLGMAELARQEGDFARAVACMKRLAEARPDWAQDKAFVLVDSLIKMGSAREAVDVLEGLGKSQPLPPWAQVLLGQGYYQLKDYARSADCYRKALDDRGQRAPAHYGLSRALDRLGRRDEAQKYRDAFRRLQGENLADFDRMQRAGTAEERIDPVPWYPVLARFHFEAGRAFAQNGRFEQAETHWRRAWALAPDRPEPRQCLAALYGQPN